MAADKGGSVKLGLFVLAGTALLVIGLYLLGSKRSLFSSSITINTSFEQVGGLRRGNNVRYAGINVGTVSAISIVNDTTVLVTMAVRTDDAGHILDNAIASLGTDGLMGNKLVNIGPGEGAGNPIAEGVRLRSSLPLDTDQMMRTLDRTNMNMLAITEDLRALSDRLNRPGNLVSLLADTTLARQVRGSLSELELAAGHVRSASADVDALLTDVRDGRGALGILVGDPAAEQQVRTWLGTMQRLADSLAHASNEVDRFARGLNEPAGTAYALTRDTVVADDLRKTVDQLQRSSATLEEDLKALQRNWFFRKYFKERDRKRKE